METANEATALNEHEVRPTVGIITALPYEYAAVKVLLESLRPIVVSGHGAGRQYLYGELSAPNGRHRIVLALLPDVGNNHASARAALLAQHFSSVNLVFMVGIAGGIPHPEKPAEHVRLGDIVVSNRDGVVEYDFGKEELRDKEIEFTPQHPPRPPSASIVETARLLQAGELEGQRPWVPYIARGLDSLSAARPSDDTDVLFSSRDPSKRINHPNDPRRLKGVPRVFLGPIASSNTLLKNPLRRDRLRDRFGVKALEMESSGISDAAWELEIQYAVVRAVCDYCDSKKGDEWQPYAAVAAAAYTRAVLEATPASNFTAIEHTQTNKPAPVSNRAKEEVFTDSRFSKRTRRNALITLLALSVFSILGLWAYLSRFRTDSATTDSNITQAGTSETLPNLTNQGKVKTVSVLIADFQGPNPNEYGVTRILKNGLEDLSGNYSDIKVEYLNEVLDGNENAERRGRERNANIIIWGNYVANKSHTDVRANFTLLDQPDYLPIKSEKVDIRSSVAQLLSFTIQDTIANRMRYLILVTSALSFYVARDFPEAIKRFSDAIAGAKNRSDIHITYFFRGTAYQALGNNDLAIADLTRCRKLKPRMVEAYNNLGVVFSNTGRYEQAIQFYLKAINIEENHATAHVNLGSEYLRKRLYQRAASEFEKAIKYDSALRAAHVLLAESYCELGKYDIAIHAINEAIKLGETADAYNLLGFAYSKNGDFEKAFANLQKAFTMDANSAEINNNLGAAYVQKGDYAKAIVHFTKALEIKADASLYHHRALANYMMGNWTEATVDFKKAIEIDSSFAEAYFGLSYTYIALQQRIAAVNAAKDYLRLIGWREYRSQYMVLVTHFGLRQSGKTKEAEQVLQQAAVRCDQSSWPYPILNYLRRKITQEDVISAANTERVGSLLMKTKKVIPLVQYVPNQTLTTEAHTYIALDLALASDTNQALLHLQWVRDQGDRLSFEYQLALSKLNELKR